SDRPCRYVQRHSVPPWTNQVSTNRDRPISEKAGDARHRSWRQFDPATIGPGAADVATVSGRGNILYACAPRLEQSRGTEGNLRSLPLPSRCSPVSNPV